MASLRNEPVTIASVVSAVVGVLVAVGVVNFSPDEVKEIGELVGPIIVGVVGVVGSLFARARVTPVERE